MYRLVNYVAENYILETIIEYLLPKKSKSISSALEMWQQGP